MMYLGILGAKMWVGPGCVKNGKKVVFIPATLLPTQFSPKTKFLKAIVSKHTNQTKRWANWST